MFEIQRVISQNSKESHDDGNDFINFWHFVQNIECPTLRNSSKEMPNFSYCSTRKFKKKLLKVMQDS